MFAVPRNGLKLAVLREKTKHFAKEMRESFGKCSVCCFLAHSIDDKTN
jgi:hypothetical protein